MQKMGQASIYRTAVVQVCLGEQTEDIYVGVKTILLKQPQGETEIMVC